MSDKKQPRWITRLIDLIHGHWNYHGPCDHINVQCYHDQHHGWVVNVAPVYQEVYGGSDDGKKVWTGFVFDVGTFVRVRGLHVEDITVASYCNQCSPCPRLMIRGKFRGRPIFLNVWLEPIRETATVEVLDTIAGRVQAKEDQ